MKAIVLLCAFVSLALPRHEAFAQATASPQSQKAGHTKAPTRSAPVQTYASSGLDRTVEKLRPNFNGHDITVVYSALEERAKPTERSEFETTEQWHQRQANLRLPPIIGGMTAGSVWGFVVDVDSNYDADNQVLQVLIPWYSRGGAEFRDLTNSPPFRCSRTGVHLPRDVGQTRIDNVIILGNTNAFGAIVPAENDSTTIYEVVFSDGQSFPTGLEAFIPSGHAVARQMKTDLSALAARSAMAFENSRPSDADERRAM